MEKLSIVLSAAGTMLGIIVVMLTSLCKLIKNSKARKMAENIIKMGNFILPYIEEAETFISFTGEEKKAYVMTKANQYAIDNGIKFNEEETSAKIDELVALCKVVNVNTTREKNQKSQNIKTDDTSCLIDDKSFYRQKNIIE